MILKDIVSQSNFDEVYNCLLKCYEKVGTLDKKMVTQGYNDIIGLEPKVNDEHLTLILTVTDEQGEKFYDVSAKKESDDIVYSLIFDPWEIWVGLKIDAEILEVMSPSEVVAHCFWEMSWNGWTLAERNKNAANQRKEYDKGKNLEERAYDMKDAEEMMTDEFLDELIAKYRHASTDSLRFDIEIIVEDFINLGLMTDQQLNKTEKIFKDDDILEAIEDIRTSK